MTSLNKQTKTCLAITSRSSEGPTNPNPTMAVPTAILATPTNEHLSSPPPTTLCPPPLSPPLTLPVGELAGDGRLQRVGPVGVAARARVTGAAAARLHTAGKSWEVTGVRSRQRESV